MTNKKAAKKAPVKAKSKITFTGISFKEGNLNEVIRAHQAELKALKQRIIKLETNNKSKS